MTTEQQTAAELVELYASEPSSYVVDLGNGLVFGVDRSSGHVLGATDAVLFARSRIAGVCEDASGPLGLRFDPLVEEGAPLGDEALAALAFHYEGTASAVLDLAGRMVVCNAQFETATVQNGWLLRGAGPDASFAALLAQQAAAQPERYGELHRGLSEVLAGGSSYFQTEFALEVLSGEVTLLALLRRLPEDHGVVVSFIDTTWKAQLMSRLAEMRQLDPATALPGTLASIKALEHAMHRQLPGSGVGVLAVGLLGLDRIGANYGPDVVNKMVVRIGDRLSQLLGPDAVYRIAEEEFVMILEHADGEGDALRALQSQVESLSGIDHLVGFDLLHVKVICGAAQVGAGTAVTPYGLYENAHRAMLLHRQFAEEA